MVNDIQIIRKTQKFHYDLLMYNSYICIDPTSIRTPLPTYIHTYIHKYYISQSLYNDTWWSRFMTQFDYLLNYCLYKVYVMITW